MGMNLPEGWGWNKNCVPVGFGDENEFLLREWDEIMKPTPACYHPWCKPHFI